MHWPWMFALGQKRTCAAQKAMSALRRIATAKADSRKRLSRLEIDRSLELGGPSYGRGQRLLFDLQQGKGCTNYEDDANDDPRGHRFIEKQRSKDDGVNRLQCHETAARVG